MLKEKGQRRLQLRQAKRRIGQDLQSFYTDILSLAAKAYPGPHTAEQAQIADDAIMDQLIYGCEDEKMRLFLLEKNPKSSREALSLATSYQSAMRFNDTIRDLTITQTSVDAITSRNDANETTDIDRRITITAIIIITAGIDRVTKTSLTILIEIITCSRRGEQHK